MLTVGSGLRFAYGFSDLIGMSASADFAYTKASDFSLGIEYSLMVVPMPKIEKAPMVYTLALSSRFYF